MKKILYVLLSSILIFTPLARASWDIWAQTLIHLVSLFAVYFYLIKENTFFRTPLDLPILGFLLTGIISYLNAASYYETRNEILNLINYVAIFYLVVNIKKDKGEKIIGTVVFTALVVSIIEMLVWFHSPWKIGRYCSIMVNPNMLAGYLVMAFPLIVGKMLKSAGMKWVYFLSGFLVLLCLFLTGSAGGIISLFCGLFIFLALMRRKIRRLVPLLILIFFAIIFLKSRETGFLNRVDWWKTAFRISFHNPLGVGAGSFGKVFLKYKIGKMNTLYAHNHFLQVLAEQGIFGFFFFVFLLLKFFKTSAKEIGGEISKAGIIAAISGILFHNFIDYNLCIPVNAILFWTLLGLGCPFSGKEYKLFSGLKKLPVKLFILYLTLFAGFQVLRPFLSSRRFCFGMNFLEKGKLEEAGGNLEKAVALDPLSGYSHAGLAGFFVTQYQINKEGSYIDEAITEMKRAIKIERYNPEFRSDLSWLYMMKGDRENAVRSMEEAILCAPSNQGYRDKLKELVG